MPGQTSTNSTKLRGYFGASKRILTFRICFETTHISFISLDVLYSAKKRIWAFLTFCSVAQIIQMFP